MIAVAVLGAYIWGNLQTKWNFEAETRPHVIISRPPTLIDVFACEITDKAMHLRTGAMRIWVKNIGHGDAVNAFISGPYLRLVPEKKTGFLFFDNREFVTEETCRTREPPKMKMMPVYAGQEVSIDLIQSVEAVSLFKTKSISVSLGSPQPEPEPSPGEKLRVQIARDAIFQLYGPVCVYYSDRRGAAYGSCRTYRLSTLGRLTFSCQESPLRGEFVPTFGGFCDN